MKLVLQSKAAILVILLHVSAVNVLGEVDSLKNLYRKITPTKLENIEQSQFPKFLRSKLGDLECYKAEPNEYFKGLYFFLNYKNNEIRIVRLFDSTLTADLLGIDKTNDTLYTVSTDLRTKEGVILDNIYIAIDSKNKGLYYKWANPTGKNEPYISSRNILLPGTQFPEIKFMTTEGKEIIINKGNIKVINWWATGCIACREEIPGLNNLVEKYKGKEIDFIAIVADNNNLEKFLKSNEFSYIQCHSDKETSKYFGDAYPRNIIVDGNNKVLHNYSGASENTYIELDKIIEKALDEKK